MLVTLHFTGKLYWWTKIPKNNTETYPWEYDKDVIDTTKSIEKGEEIKQGKLSYDSVAMHRGIDWTYQHHDNGKYR